MKIDQKKTELFSFAHTWFKEKGWQQFPFQEDCWEAFVEGKNGLLNAPTGSGKTYALWWAVLLDAIEKNEAYQKPGLKAIWITPIRALASEIAGACKAVIDDLGWDWTVGIRNGDTSPEERARQSKRMPDLLITTPESLHLLIAQKNYEKRFENVKAFIVDEWHELTGSKRGVQVQLALSRLKGISSDLRAWAISATIGNLEESAYVLLGKAYREEGFSMVKANIEKQTIIESILPDEIEKFPWAGHLGIKLLEKIIPIINSSESTLIFTNTRAQCEIWYQKILETAPELAGIIAMHHGSIDKDLRIWVEDALDAGQLKAVVCTSSLDLGVDFRPVESIVQIGGPKNIARFMQRAGRSGHRPGAISKIYFLPTHSLELIEGAALREGINSGVIEGRLPYIRSFDVLIQYLVTLSISGGFEPSTIYPEVKSTFAYSSMNEDEWNWVLKFITQGGESLEAYEEFNKVGIHKGRYMIQNRRLAMRHRLSIGTIVSDHMMRVKYVRGGTIGTVEEWFVNNLKPGDVFWFGGRSLEFVSVSQTDVLVKKSKKITGKIPSYQGGRMPLSSQLSSLLRKKLADGVAGRVEDIEIETLMPLLNFQAHRSHIPSEDEFLIEIFKTKDGNHICMYPFEGRFVHEGLSSLFAYRISLFQKASFSMAFNDYGFELLTNKDIELEEIIEKGLFDSESLYEDIQASINNTEMARSKFRDIATISGMVFSGYPGKYIADKHLKSSSQLFFDMFKQYDQDNLLLNQAYEEVADFQLEESRLRECMDRIRNQKVIIKYPDKPTPFSFPIMVDRLREKMTSESLESRIEKMTIEFGD